MIGIFDIDDALIEQISRRMGLREPNKQALETVAAYVSDHYDVRDEPSPFEGVVVSATGVGKTYVMGAVIDYLAQHRGWTDFVVVVPGATIRQKTVENFTPGAAKSLTKMLGVRTVLITADNYNTPAMVQAINDPSTVKVYVLTVQVLLQPNEGIGRRTHQYTEGLGGRLYGLLAGRQDLVVLADEHHLYYGPRFSEAVRGLNPKVLLGLTATPHRATREEDVIYRYPLAAAIGAKLVKTPVIVGRKDDRKDLLTKLVDATTLLEAKERAVGAYRARVRDAAIVNPVMLVLARDTGEADKITGLLRDSSFRGGLYSNAVIQVDSSVTEKNEPAMWERLSRVEEPNSPIRVIVSVRMLKEGWDVKNVYVLLSTQPSLSDVLTEQVLGRGLRLAFGKYTGVQMLDTLEVIAHDRFRQLLDRAGILNEELVSYRTRATIRTDEQGQDYLFRDEEEVSQSVLESASTHIEGYADDSAAIQIGDVDTRIATGASTTAAFERPPVELRHDAPAVELPILRATKVGASFSLRDITDESPFREMGRRLRVNPDSELRRMIVSAKKVRGIDGVERIQLVRATAQDRVVTQTAIHMTSSELRGQLLQAMLAAPAVSARREHRDAERLAAEPLLDAFFDGLNGGAEELLSAYLERAAARLIRLVNDEQHRLSTVAETEQVAVGRPFRPQRQNTRAQQSDDPRGVFGRDTAYRGFHKSLMTADWFDSSPERDVALLLEDDVAVDWWVRLQTGDLPISWRTGGGYNPDFLVSVARDQRWIVEVKADNQMKSAEVSGKRVAAKRWANYVNTSPEFAHGPRWSYLLVSESDIEDAKGSWAALKGLGGA
ncbi:DEAD/DEAH box helicase family protein [Microbacterium sp. RURRCA19A]|uniref:DEAD/DEAH box helicase family protein n=1 Tax=Microbacterium sp. RURRCA19A TaxID=1907391 RepID=UPI00095648EF|nr:DEAD/DEAH box helicase family protein [Microbacterium sp. RURRCA19A]SIR95769.1 type III restriction enzyme [Microbacterium sp. RURRCA19A]